MLGLGPEKRDLLAAERGLEPRPLDEHFRYSILNGEVKEDQ